ncbi:hypothetical protein [Aeromonas hydrophila]|uniref:hypothetical protein n=1 Tax=Aeromonas hydrophila TaxID=644 RepID=UPI002B480E5E|nr:hypothetical protein [Aeromonas hydrophila]
MSVKIYSRLTKPESLAWLKANDPEYDWAGQNLNRKQLQEAIADNLFKKRSLITSSHSVNKPSLQV